ncbi:MAG: MMPL family transporter [Dehalococcoidia bacterium]
MFAGLARFAFRYRWAVLAVYVILLPLAAVEGSGVFKALKPGGYDDPSTQSFKARQQILAEFGVGAADVVTLYTVRTGTVQDDAAKRTIGSTLDTVAEDPAVVRVLSLYNTGAAQFVSRNGTQTFAVVSLKGDDQAKIDAFHRLEPQLRADGVTTQFGGEIPVFEAFNKTVEQDLRRAEIIAFPVTAILLVVIFGSAVAAGVPLVLGIFAIVFALATVRAIAAITDLSVFALNVITVLGLGLAIDYSLFILNRYREELKDRTVEEAIVAAVSTTGRAAAFSGVTLAASLVGLFVFPQVFLRSMAIGGIAVAIVAIVIATTLLPALVAVLGSKIDALRLPWPRGDGEPSAEGGFWHRIAFAVMRHPVIIAISVVALLLVLGSPFLKFRPTKQDYRALSPSLEARQVSDVLDSQFVPHETTPHTVYLTATDSMVTPERIGALFDYVQALQKDVPGIQRIDSLFSIQPGLTKAQYIQLASTTPSQLPPDAAAALPLFVKDTHARLSIVSNDAFDSDQAQSQVSELRRHPLPAGMSALVGGNSADLFDTKASIRSRIPYTLLVIASVTFIVLFLVYGSFTLPIKAMVMNLLSLTASAGLIVWIFQYGRLENILRYKSLGTLDVTLPILLFGIVFGLSMDYEVLMLSRVREEYVRTGDNTLAVALGLEKTGRLITSAAALLVVVIIAFATSSITLMKSLGVGMAIAITVDATIVRALLVPAAMRLMGHWNWWAPAPMKALWERLGFADLEGNAAPSPIVPAMAVAGVAPTSAAALVSLSAQAAMAPAVADAPAAGMYAIPVRARAAAPPERTLLPPARVLAYLVEQRGARPGRTFQLTTASVAIGRDAGCDFVIDDPTVSGNHAEIQRTADGRFVLLDCESTRGSFVNGEQVTESRPLLDNDVLRLGNTLLAFKTASGGAPVVPDEDEDELLTRTVIIRRRPRMLAYLVETQGDEVGRVFDLTDDIITIGRSPRNKIVLTDTAISGRHAQVLRGLDGGLVIEDRGSSNGTYVNDKAITETHALQENDAILLGNTTLQLKIVVLPHPGE